jgi:methyl-accepting chemotaxis protein
VARVDQGTVLVDKAGATMNEVVGAIQRVTDIMAEISAASTEQGIGMAQVGEAVSLIDENTQQNAALVEEMAAAASALNTQATDLVDAVAVFKLERQASAPVARAAPLARAAAAQPQRPAKTAARQLANAPSPAVFAAPRSFATAGHDAEWETF